MTDILLVDDDLELVESLTRALAGLVAPRSIRAAGNALRALECAASESPLVAVLDLCLDERVGVESGFRLLSALREANQEIRIIVLTGHGSVEHGVRAMSLGAGSFLEKPVDPEHLAALLRDALAQAELAHAYAQLVREKMPGLAAELCGTSQVIQRLRGEIEFAASTKQPVVLLGETGTGKGLCARLIHRYSSRAAKKFVHYHPNFAGGDIVQSELFGHRKGAFTGAVESRRGLALDAAGGTLFIDELDSIPPDTQVLLLDLVQEQRVRPVGSDVYQHIDCRFIAATNKPLHEAVSSGAIRRDLYHRLAHCVITIPSLRERIDDVPLLAEAALASVNEREGVGVFALEPAAVDRLQSYAWPGNVRELYGVVESAAYRARFARRSAIGAGDLRFQDSYQSEKTRGEEHPRSFHEQVEEFKRRLVQEALERSSGNQVQAALELGIDRGTIKRLR